MSVYYKMPDFQYDDNGIMVACIDDRRTVWQRFDRIQNVQAYRVGNQLYLTPKAAAKKLAWSMIFTKYCNRGDLVKIEDIKNAAGYECDCPNDHERGDYGQIVQFKHEACQLHNRHNGYFKRLHARLVRVLLAIHTAPEPK